MITLCIPTLNRYDLLEQCIKSAEDGFIKPDRYLVIDNGGSLQFSHPKLEIVSFGYNIGVAKAWNYFINATEEIRIISNDDIIFFPNTIQKLVEGYNPSFICCANEHTKESFSMFTISDYIVDRVGYFDDTLSPNYAYFEDNDYHYRMRQLGLDILYVPGSAYGHLRSATLKAYPSRELDEHHNKFRLAQVNYIAKWGGLPGNETFTTPYGK